MAPLVLGCPGVFAVSGEALGRHRWVNGADQCAGTACSVCPGQGPCLQRTGAVGPRVGGVCGFGPSRPCLLWLHSGRCAPVSSHPWGEPSHRLMEHRLCAAGFLHGGASGPRAASCFDTGWGLKDSAVEARRGWGLPILGFPVRTSYKALPLQQETPCTWSRGPGRA